jgi:hypothetical protein
MYIFEIRFTESTISSNIKLTMQCFRVIMILQYLNYNYCDISTH